MPPLIRGVSFADALARLESVGWVQDGQEGSHVALIHPNIPGRRIYLPDHRGRDLAPDTLGATVARAGLTREQFRSLTGSGHRRNVSRIRKEVYGMAD
jgi:predicted RNA binding protein YcfA (HicA-like mRNA interferase family)